SDFQYLNDQQTATTSITYTVVDADGATTTATLTVTVTGQTDAPPVITPEDSDGTVTGAHNSVIEASGDIVTGSVTVSAEAGIRGVTVGGQDVTGANNTPVVITTDKGILTITGYDAATGKITYSYQETGGADDHSGGDNAVRDSFPVVVTDLAGVSNSNDLVIQIIDTEPTAEDDVASVTEDATAPITGNVLANDTLGADASTTVINTADAKYGTLIDNGDGTWSYQLNNGLEAVQALNDGDTLTETIRYTITDADGDIAEAVITITINGQTDGPPVITPEDSDGTVTGAHNSVIEGTGDIVTGSVTVSAEAGIRGVTVGGQDVTGANTTPVVITTDKGILTITGYDAATGKITYSYQETGGADDHSDGDNAVRDLFQVAVTDVAGKTTTGDLVIQIIDTEPTAEDDVASVTEDTTAPITGNVLANDTLGADASTTVINTADAKYGTLIDNGDGTWSYQLNNGLEAVQALNDGDTLTETIRYTITDADGDIAEAVITITINGQTDGPPVITPEDTDGTVTGAHNSVIEGTGDIVTGSVTVSAEAGIRGVTVGGQDVTGANNTPVVITTDKGILTITGYDAATGKITYSYQETGGADDHSDGDNAVRDLFQVAVTDVAGKTTTGDLVIQIIDTEPKAEDDTASVTEDATAPITGNVLANDTLGADASTTVINTADAKYGTLIDNGDGTWSYQLNNGLEAVQALNDGDTLTETIRYTITDADGDIAEAVITITINGQTDGPPVITPEDSDGTVTGAHNSVVEGTGDIVTGSVTVSAEAGIRGVTVGGQDVTGANNTPVVITTDKGILTITGYDAATGKITYSYQETGGADDHSDGDNAVRDLFQVAVTDVAGKTTTGDLVIQIIDTEPKAEDDVASVTEDATAPITGNVLANDTLGADASTTVINTADAKYGTLIDNGDGTWSYQLNNGLEAVQALNDGDTLTETIRYTITDADGDIAEAVITITINGQTDGPPVITPEDSDGTVTGAHNSVIEGTGDIVTGSVTVSAEAGIRGVTVGGQDVTGANTTPVVITTDKGILTITGYDAATGKIIYSYQETGGADDHSDGDNAVRDLFQVAVTDVAGKTTTGDLVIQIIDTEPTAEDDVASVTEDATAPITGNVLANDTLGADASTTVINTADAKYGTLIDNGDGTWSYQLNNGLEAVQALNDGDTLTETIRYTITDADGDIAEAVITITINGQTDGPPVITPEDSDGTVTGAHNSVIEGTGDIVTGSVTVSAEAGIRGVTVGGQDVTGANNTPVVITTDKGILTITGYDAATGKITYSYQETGGADDHSDGDNAVRDLFQVAVTDVAGKTTTGDLVIQIIDTEPTAEDDVASVTEDATAPITGNVLANDTLGADASTTVINTADAKYGTLIDNGDGTWSYQLNNGLEAVQALNDGDTLTETIRYTITDADGDIAEAVITITINGQTDGPPVITPEDTDGTVTGAHNSVVEGTGDIVTGSVTV
ncbi:VCBS domain-containing protein, partial [Achromobacter sp. HZ01]|uniref:beta strand repeat-containing protein n=1 Tax=Achromobacter sp. HZ01 TaxID=1416886 RepID=UPI001AEFADEC